MIKRIVKLTFQENKIEDFLAIFEANKSNIRHFEGCQHVELLRVQSQENVFFTFSIWEDEKALENYGSLKYFERHGLKRNLCFRIKRKHGLLI